MATQIIRNGYYGPEIDETTPVTILESLLKEQRERLEGERIKAKSLEIQLRIKEDEVERIKDKIMAYEDALNKLEGA